MSHKNNNLGFIGAGNMAGSLIGGLIKSGYKKSQIFTSSPETEHLKKLKEEFSVNVTKSNEEVLDAAKTIVLAVKPNVISAVLKQLSKQIKTNTNLLISIVAGLSINSIEGEIGSETKIIRAMPNTPASIGLGVSALTNNKLVNQDDKIRAENIFKSVGIVCWLKETSFDLYTALIGSGPAYIFYVIEALQKSTKNLNLEEKMTKTLITEMIRGSAALANVSKDSVSQLREKVTSPGGVTEKALEILNQNRVDQILTRAILEGEKRSKDLGEKTDG